MFGELLSAGASLIGGLFGGDDEKKVTNEVDYRKMAKSATKAGFNPLTALRNGGAAGFTTTTSPSASLLPAALSQVGGALGNALDEKIDPIASRPDTALVDQQLRGVDYFPAAPRTPRLYSGSTYVGTLVSRQPKPVASVSALKAGDTVGDRGFVAGETSVVSNPYGKNSSMTPDPNVPDVDELEKRVPDDITNPAGWYVYGSDLVHSANQYMRGKGFGAGPNELGANIRRGIVDLWTEPSRGSSLSRRGFASRSPRKPTPRPYYSAPKTKVGRYAR